MTQATLGTLPLGKGKIIKFPEPTVAQMRERMENAKNALEGKRAKWKILHAKLNLDYNIPGFSNEELVKLSRFYPMVRNIVAGIAFHHPRIFVNAKPLVENSFKDLSQVSRIVERILNQAISMMQVKNEVQQMIFDMLFCGVGWLKMGYNPPGQDAEAPYTLNDRFQDDFPMVQRRDPRLIHVSPLCEPHTIATCPIIFEEIYAPIEFLIEDDRISKSARGKLSPMSDEDADIAGATLASDLAPDMDSVIDQARAHGKIIRLFEAHDREHRKFYLFADGVDEALREEIHPFIEADVGQDPATGEMVIEPKPGFLLKNGYQYIPMKLDTDMDSFYPTPPMGYIEDVQDMQVESVSRRLDQMKRFSRLLLLLASEEKQRPGIQKALEAGRDGTVLLLETLDGLKELDFSVGSPGQQQLEQDAKVYEAETLDIGDLALAKGASRKTATEVSLSASRGTLTREWMQLKVAEVYSTIGENILSMFRDVRYFPETLIANTAGEDADPVTELLTTDDFLHEMELDIDAQSMQPLVAERDRDEAFMLYDRFNGNPMIDQTELTKMTLKASGIRSWERMFKGAGKAEAEAAAWLENTGFLIKGVDPGVRPGQDHRVHMESHSQESFGKIPEFRQMLPEQQQKVMQIVEAHMEAHKQAHQEAVSPSSSATPTGLDGRLQSGGGDIQSQVRSAAQGFAQAAEKNAETLSGQG
jgi:hypothetical protein